MRDLSEAGGMATSAKLKVRGGGVDFPARPKEVRTGEERKIFSGAGGDWRLTLYRPLKQSSTL